MSTDIVPELNPVLLVAPRQVETSSSPNDVVTAMNNLFTVFRTNKLIPHGPNNAGVAFAKMVDWIVNPNSLAIPIQKTLAKYENYKAIIGAFVRDYSTFFEDFGIRLMLNESDQTEQKVHWAQFNQYLAQDLYKMNFSEDPLLYESVDQFIDIFLELAEVSKGSSTNKILNNIAKRLNGARVQSAVMTLVNQKGNTFFVPDADNRKEVLQWDVNGRTDMVVVNNKGEMFLIDLKAVYQEEKKGNYTLLSQAKISERTYEDDVHGPIIDSIVDKYRLLAKTNQVKAVTISIPSNKGAIGIKGQKISPSIAEVLTEYLGL